MEPGEVPPGVEEELNTLLANFPSGLMASRLLVEFRLFFGKELNMGTSHLLLLGKFEYGGGPIFKVVIEC